MESEDRAMDRNDEYLTENKKVRPTHVDDRWYSPWAK